MASEYVHIETENRMPKIIPINTVYKDILLPAIIVHMSKGKPARKEKVDVTNIFSEKVEAFTFLRKILWKANEMIFSPINV
jgi:hypothetical protein